MNTKHVVTLTLISLLSACATFREDSQQASNDRPTLTPADPSQGHAEPAAAPAAPAAVATPAAPAAHGGGHAAATDGVSPEQSLQWLKNGNLRYIKSHRRSDGLASKDRVRLSLGQKPHAIILSCSDSRVPPEHVFDQTLGEIFVIRVAGQALDSSVIGSIEYAVAHLGSRLIFVMGHESCGAVKAAIQTPVGQSTGSPSIDRMVAGIRPHIHAQLPVTTVVPESSENAKGVAADLIAQSAIIRDAVASGKVKVASGIYYLKSGQVEFFH